MKVKLSALEYRKLWDLQGEFQDTFAWHKGELDVCAMGEHSMNST